MRRLKLSELTKCKKCGSVTIKRLAEEQNGHCIDCYDNMIINTLGHEAYFELVEKRGKQLPILFKNKGKYYETTTEEILKLKKKEDSSKKPAKSELRF